MKSLEAADVILPHSATFNTVRICPSSIPGIPLLLLYGHTRQGVLQLNVHLIYLVYI